MGLEGYLFLHFPPDKCMLEIVDPVVVTFLVKP